MNVCELLYTYAYVCICVYVHVWYIANCILHKCLFMFKCIYIYIYIDVYINIRNVYRELCVSYLGSIY